jgi:hypothetical protein
MKYILFFALALTSISSNAQFGLENNYRSLGMGGGYMFNINDGALNTNPSLLGWQTTRYKHKFDISLYDFQASAFSPTASLGVRRLSTNSIELQGENENLAVDFTDMLVWDEMISSYDYATQTYYTYDTLASREFRDEYKASLMKENTVNWSRKLLGFTYISDGHGTFSFKLSEETNAQFKLSENFSDLWAYGKTSSYFDSLVLIDGTHLANDSSNYQNEILNQVYLGFSNDTLTISDILEDSNFEFLQTRKYSFGWGKEFLIAKDGRRLFLGGNLNVIEGLRMIQILNEAEGLTIANFDGPSSLERRKRNAGLGASISLSGTLSFKEKLDMSFGVNNLGFIHWKRRSGDGAIGVYSQENQEYSDFAYGVSPTVFFNDQLQDSANFNWTSVAVDLQDASIYRATASNVHFGIRYQLGSKFAIGTSVIQPINPSAVGNLKKTLVNFNYELTLKKFTFFSGLNNRGSTLQMPMGLSIGSRTSRIEAGVSIADLLGLVQKSKDSNFSIGVGLKYRIF